MTPSSSANPVDDRNQDNTVSHAPSPQQIESNNDDLLLLPSLQKTHTLLANRIVLKRQAAIQELLTTEKTYGHDLEVLVNHFFAAIEQADCIQLATKLDLVRNAHAILDFQRNFSAALLRATEVQEDEEGEDEESMRDHRLVALCECFCDWADGFEVYIPYCIYQDKAAGIHKKLVATNPGYAAILDRLYALARSRDERRTFEDYMIMPVQRLLKYRLILETISKTVQDDEVEHLIVAKALSEMHLVALRLNTEKSGMEARKKTELFIDRIDTSWVQAPLKPYYRQLNPCALIGTLDVRLVKTSKEDKIRRLGCALFDTFMIMAKAKRHDKYEPRYWFPLYLFELEDVQNPSPSAAGGPCHAWILRSKLKTFECMAMCDQEKQLWMQAIQKAIKASRELFTIQSSSPAEYNGSPDVTFLHNLPTSSGSPPPDTSTTAAASATNTGSKTLGSFRPGSASSIPTVSSGYFSWRDSLHAESPTRRALSPPPSPATTPTTSPTTAPQLNMTPATATAAASSSNGVRPHGSLSDLRDLVSDFRAHRRHHHQYSDVDARFVDVCTTPILMARAQHLYRDCHPVARNRSSRIVKSMSMVALSSFHHHHPSSSHSYTPPPNTTMASTLDSRPPPPLIPTSSKLSSQSVLLGKLSLHQATTPETGSMEDAVRKTSSPTPLITRSSSSSSSISRRRRGSNARFTMDFSRPFSKVVEKFSASSSSSSSNNQTIHSDKGGDDDEGKTPLKSKRWASSDTQLGSSTRTTTTAGEVFNEENNHGSTPHLVKSAFRRIGKVKKKERASEPSYACVLTERTNERIDISRVMRSK
ncbi:hypothetical protein BX666DRAFT_1997908 [Dichotomocladium elegans]|nr:hypothetical protein BX666DRAFT_1997908 [Dichotomocladium elegans]